MILYLQYANWTRPRYSSVVLWAYPIHINAGISRAIPDNAVDFSVPLGLRLVYPPAQCRVIELITY